MVSGEAAQMREESMSKIFDFALCSSLALIFAIAAFQIIAG